MTDEPAWEKLHDGHWDTTERLAIPGGWLVRTVWRKAVEMGQPHLDGSAIVFVPFHVVEHDALSQKIAQRELREAIEEAAAQRDEYKYVGPLTAWPDDTQGLATQGLAGAQTALETNNGEETEADAQVEVVEVSGEPEDVGQSGHNHEPRRRRSRE